MDKTPAVVNPLSVKLNRAQRRAINPDPRAVFCAVAPGGPFKTGERFTVKGLQFLPDGRLKWDCAPGYETEFTAVVCETK